jgi:tetratricopeptide (TPR) repeat protein
MARRILAALAIASALVLPAAPSRAQSGQPGTVFDFAANARTVGMGGAGVALSESASSLYENPAGLGRVRGHDLALHDSMLPQGVSYNYLGYARQASMGGWGGELLRVGASGIEGRDANNLPAGSFSYSEQAAAFGFGSRAFLDNRLGLGASLKFVSRSLGRASNRLYGADVGAQFNPALLGGRLRLGLRAANVIAGRMGDTADRMPLSVKAGAAMTLIAPLTLAADFTGDRTFSVGAEYVLGLFALRAGFQENGPSFGAGFIVKNWRTDFALSNNAALGTALHLSLGARFGVTAARARPEARLKGGLSEAERALSQQRYADALQLYDRALASNLDEKDASAARVRARAERLRELMREAGATNNPAVISALALQDEQGRLGLRAVQALLDHEDAKALLLAQAASGTEIRSDAYASLLEAVAKITYQKPARDEIQPLNMLIETKLRKAVSLFKQQNYEAAAESCREALMLDPESSLARERLGSAYYAMGLKDKAVVVWREALRLDPGNDSLKDFLNKIGEAQ